MPLQSKNPSPREEESRIHKELSANHIFGKAVEACAWKPGGRKLFMNYERTTVNPDAVTALTASKMTWAHLARLGWTYIPQTPGQTSHALHQESLARRIETGLHDWRRTFDPTGTTIRLPADLRLDLSKCISLDSRGPIPAIGQLRLLSNALYILWEDGNFPDENPNSPSGKCPISIPIKAGRPKISWAEKDEPIPWLPADQVVLESLLHVSPFGVSSEIEVERTIGSVLQAAFQTLQVDRSMFMVSSNTQLLFYGAFTAFGSHPEPDLVARCLNAPHKLFTPVCWIGESKIAAECNRDTVAQLATSVHSTLTLFVVLWSLVNGDKKEAPFPSWAFLAGITYTEEEVAIYGFYPFGGYYASGTAKAWQFKVQSLATFKRIQDQQVIYKLHFMDSLIRLRNHAWEFGKHMEKLFEEVFLSRHTVNINLARIKHLHSDPKKLERINNALSQSFEEWNKILRN